MGAVFAGELSQEDVDSIVKDLPNEKSKELRENLESHIGKPESKELPEDSHAITAPTPKKTPKNGSPNTSKPCQKSRRTIAECRLCTG